jgi:hypothetical protein
MKRNFLILFFLAHYGYSYDEDDFYNFIEYIKNELQRARELCVVDLNKIYNFEEHLIWRNEYKKHLYNITIDIRKNIILFDNDVIKNILKIIDYEANNILTTDNYVINSEEVLLKIELCLDLGYSIYIIKYYETIIPEYNFY